MRVAILAADLGKRKISLSLKALAQDPWQTVSERYTANALVSGAVTRITNFGAFVQLEEGVEGLIHISQLSSQRVRTVADVVKVGDVIQLRVLSVDPAQHRISLSLKAAKEEEVPAAAAATAEPVAAKPEKKRKRELRGGLSY